LIFIPIDILIASDSRSGRRQGRGMVPLRNRAPAAERRWL